MNGINTTRFVADFRHIRAIKLFFRSRFNIAGRFAGRENLGLGKLVREFVYLLKISKTA